MIFVNVLNWQTKVACCLKFCNLGSLICFLFSCFSNCFLNQRMSTRILYTTWHGSENLEKRFGCGPKRIPPNPSYGKRTHLEQLCFFGGFLFDPWDPWPFALRNEQTRTLCTASPQGGDQYIMTQPDDIGDLGGCVKKSDYAYMNILDTKYQSKRTGEKAIGHSKVITSTACPLHDSRVSTDTHMLVRLCRYVSRNCVPVMIFVWGCFENHKALTGSGVFLCSRRIGHLWI